MRVSNLRIEGRIVHARLVSGFEKLSSDGEIVIELPDNVHGTNCVALGRVDIPVFVAGKLIWSSNGKLALEAIPIMFRPLPRRSKAELDSYIVDPEFKARAERDSAKE